MQPKCEDNQKRVHISNWRLKSLFYVIRLFNECCLISTVYPILKVTSSGVHISPNIWILESGVHISYTFFRFSPIFLQYENAPFYASKLLFLFPITCTWCWLDVLLYKLNPPGDPGGFGVSHRFLAYNHFTIFPQLGYSVQQTFWVTTYAELKSFTILSEKLWFLRLRPGVRLRL